MLVAVSNGSKHIEDLFDQDEKKKAQIIALAVDGLKVESAAEKQWFLEQIALRLGARISNLAIEPSVNPIPKPSADPIYFWE